MLLLFRTNPPTCGVSYPTVFPNLERGGFFVLLQVLVVFENWGGRRQAIADSADG
jgi:hypothetical protein